MLSTFGVTFHLCASALRRTSTPPGPAHIHTVLCTFLNFFLDIGAFSLSFFLLFIFPLPRVTPVLSHFRLCPFLSYLQACFCPFVFRQHLPHTYFTSARFSFSLKLDSFQYFVPKGGFSGNFLMKSYMEFSHSLLLLALVSAILVLLLK